MPGTNGSREKHIQGESHEREFVMVPSGSFDNPIQNAFQLKLLPR